MRWKAFRRWLWRKLATLALWIRPDSLMDSVGIFSDKISINYSTLLPPDDKWHLLALSMSVWVRRVNGGKPEKRPDSGQKVYVDGMEVEVS